MKTFQILTLAIGLLLSALIFTGCKKKEGAQGPQGPAGPQGPTGQGLAGTNSGFITGTVTGTRTNGTPFTEPFSYTYYFGNSSGTLDTLTWGSGYRFSMARSVNDIFSYNYSSIDVMTALKSSSTGTLSFDFGFEKSLGNNQLFRFSASTYTATATGLSYNASSGLFSGTLNVTFPGSQNNTGNPATIVGSFQATLMEVVHIKHLGSSMKAD
jgi:hypothetical protein